MHNALHGFDFSTTKSPAMVEQQALFRAGLISQRGPQRKKKESHDKPLLDLQEKVKKCLSQKLIKDLPNGGFQIQGFGHCEFSVGQRWVSISSASS